MKSTHYEVLDILDDVLRLNRRAADIERDTLLLGAVPELDSMAVLAIITRLEERFGFTIADDELDGSHFATVGSLIDFVSSKVTG